MEAIDSFVLDFELGHRWIQQAGVGAPSDICDPHASCVEDRHNKPRSMTAQLQRQAKMLGESVSSLSGATRSCFSAMLLMR